MSPSVMTDLFFVLCVIAVEIPACAVLLIWVVWREIVPPQEPYFPPANHQHPQQLSCGHFELPYCVYPHGQIVCRACYESRGTS